MRRASRFLVVALAGGLAVAAGALPASAATDGLWYYDVLGIPAAQSDGMTGEGVTIAVIDGPINTDVPTLRNANIEVRDDSFCYADATATSYLPSLSTDLGGGPLNASHGTNVASFVVGTGDGYDGQPGVKGIAPGATLLYYTAWTGNVDGDSDSLQCYIGEDDDFAPGAVGSAMNEAMDAGADIISVSAGLSPGDKDIYTAYIRAAREGVVVVGALSNTSAVELNAGWPALANGAVAVQAADSAGAIQATGGVPNDNRATTVIAPGVGVTLQGVVGGSWEEQRIGSGTSYAAPIVAGLLALGKQGSPEATGNQLIQSLIRTTGGEDHEAYYDPSNLIGFGAASATGMLSVDIADYPDENPLITDAAGALPSRADIVGSGAETPSPTASEPSTVDEDGGFDATALVVAILIGAGVLVLAVVVVVVVVVVRRSKKSVNNRNQG